MGNNKHLSEWLQLWAEYFKKTLNKEPPMALFCKKKKKMANISLYSHHYFYVSFWVGFNNCHTILSCIFFTEEAFFRRKNILNKNQTHQISSWLSIQSLQDFTIFFCDFCDQNERFCGGNFQKFVKKCTIYI